MSDVIQLDQARPAAKSVFKSDAPESRAREREYQRIRDDVTISTVAEWRVARAEAQIAWAKDDLATGHGCLPDGHLPDCDTSSFKRMREIEQQLAMWRPTTVLGCREVLRAAVTILAHAQINPDESLAQGPVINLVRNVMDALEWLPGPTDVRSAELRRLARRR